MQIEPKKSKKLLPEKYMKKQECIFFPFRILPQACFWY